MKSYIKIYGPPIVKALRALEKIAVESPEVLIKSFYDAITPPSGPSHDVIGKFWENVPGEVSLGRRAELISTSGHTLGEHDFFFEWARNPTWEDVEDLISKIDEALGPLGCKYTIVTR